MSNVKGLSDRNPELRIVVRELPIISPQNPDAARMALAAAEQGKYPAFHDAMFEAGQLDPQTIEAVAQKVGLDLDRARKVAASPTVEAEIRSEEHTSELQSLMRIPYAVFCLKKKNKLFYNIHQLPKH